MDANNINPADTGERLLMLPGLICDSRTFTSQFQAFDRAMPAADYGDADDLAEMAAIVLAEAPPRFALLGHSMGARVALEVMRRAPERVTRLALVSTGVHLPSPTEGPSRHALRDIGRANGMAALVDAWLPPMVASPRCNDAAFMAPLRIMCIEAGLSRFEAQIAALLDRPEVESLLPQIACPVLVAVGREDRWSPPSQHEAIAALIPDARLVIIEGAGHMLPLEAPGALNHAIAGWFNQPAQPRIIQGD
ncbi:MAG: alpha/beta hydrolase [Sphingomonas sp.]